MLVGYKDRIQKMVRSELLKVRQTEIAKAVFKRRQGMRIGEVFGSISRGTF